MYLVLLESHDPGDSRCGGYEKNGWKMEEICLWKIIKSESPEWLLQGGLYMNWNPSYTGSLGSDVAKWRVSKMRFRLRELSSHEKGLYTRWEVMWPVAVHLVPTLEKVHGQMWDMSVHSGCEQVMTTMSRSMTTSAIANVTKIPTQTLQWVLVAPYQLLQVQPEANIRYSMSMLCM